MDRQSIIKDIADSINFFQRTFQVTVALALGESFKQFVADESKDRSDNVGEEQVPSHIHYERLPALVTFVSIIIPFFQGMNREFYLSYLRDNVVLTDYYPFQLLLDGSAFIIESALFFIMSRALVISRLRSFVSYIIFLMIIDSIWTLLGGLPIYEKFIFVGLNIILAMFMAAAFFYLKGKKDKTCYIYVSVCVMIINLAIMVGGYYLSWDMYFPKPPPANEAGTTSGGGKVSHSGDSSGAKTK